MLKRIWRDESGFTLMEVLVGIVILMLVLWAVSGMQLSVWRAKAADEDAYAKYADSSLGPEWFIRDARKATGFDPFADGASSLKLLRSGGRFYQYTFDSATKTVTRLDETGSAQIVARQVSSLTFASENSGLTIRLTMQVDLQDGGKYEFISRATLRAKPKPRP